MDPNICYREMCDAIDEVDLLLATARERAAALHGWLKSGGCFPEGVSESKVRTVIDRVFLRTQEVDDE